VPASLLERTFADHDDAPVVREPVSVDRWEQPEWRVEWGESVRELRAVLGKLTRPQRQALTLHYFEDRPYDEIAVTMGVPLNTVKSHILRGKEHLARLLRAGRFPTVPRIGFAATS
jgi:RNA polymerase sigma-70 factor (ECF subfamily)